jgi:hypothetical protein
LETGAAVPNEIFPVGPDEPANEKPLVAGVEDEFVKLNPKSVFVLLLLLVLFVELGAKLGKEKELVFPLPILNPVLFVRAEEVPKALFVFNEGKAEKVNPLFVLLLVLVFVFVLAFIVGVKLKIELVFVEELGLLPKLKLLLDAPVPKLLKLNPVEEVFDDVAFVLLTPKGEVPKEEMDELVGLVKEKLVELLLKVSPLPIFVDDALDPPKVPRDELRPDVGPSEKVVGAKEEFVEVGPPLFL